MNHGTLPIDEQDIRFQLFEHLRVQELFAFDTYAHLSKEDVELVFQEGFRFAKEQIWPTNADADTLGCHFEGGQVKTPPAFKPLFKKYMENGWLKLTAAEAWGGAGLPAVTGLALGEAMTSANLSFSAYGGLSRGVARVVDHWGTDWQRKTFVPRLFDGEWTGTMCLTEPQAGTAVGDARTTAKKEGDHYLISGTKIFITGGEQDLTENIIHLVLARTADAPAGIKGLSLFIVPKIWIHEDGSLGDANDVQCTGIEHKMGLNGSATCQLAFGEAGTCRGWLIGEENQGIQVMFQLMNEARIGTGIHGLAAASVAYQKARDYAYERVQGVALRDMKDVNAPRVTISEHPDVKRMLFTMKAQVEGMRSLLMRAARYGDLSRAHPDEDERRRAEVLLGLLTPICKAYCSDVGFDVTIMAIQTLGGAGYLKDHPVEQLARDVKIASIYEGANGIQALDLIGRKLARNHGEAFMLFAEELEGFIEKNQDHPVVGQEVQTFKGEVQRLRETMGSFAQAGLSGDVEMPALGAVHFLKMMGNVCLSWNLLEQAVVAQDGLSRILLEEKADDAAAAQNVVAENTAARFYKNKVATARFFVRTLLPENVGLAQSIQATFKDILELDLKMG
jgi:alkylation response protein AidB-like acyl-CoA dehydrogenase